MTKVVDEMEMRVAKMHENDGDRTAELELPGGEKGGTAELWSEVMDEIEMSVAEPPSNCRRNTAELELPGGEESGTAELGDVSEHDSDRVSL